MRRAAAGLLAAAAVVAQAAVLAAGIAHAEEGSPSSSLTAPVDRTWFVLVPGATLEGLLDVPAFAALATGNGGAAIMVRQQAGDPLTRILRAAEDPANGLDVRTIELGEGRAVAPPDLATAARGAVTRIREGSRGDRVQVLVVGTPTVEQAFDGTLPLSGAVVAAGPVDELFAGGSLRTLTSDSTHRDGVIDDDDLVPTVFEAQDAQVPTGGGSPVRVVDEAPAVRLAERYEDARRLVVPVGSTAVAWVTAGGIFAVVVLWARRRLPDWVLMAAAAVPLSVPPLAVSMLLAGHLPSIEPLPVAALVVGVPLAVVIAGEVAVRRVGPRTVLAWVGAGVLGALAVEAALGWTAILTPVLGGSQLDGARFYGMPNVAIGLLVGAAVMVAQRLRSTVAGTAVIAAAGLFAGLPWTGANFGGAVTAFAAAGLWAGLRRRDRWWAVCLWAIGAVGVGMAVVIAAHRSWASSPTHITNAVEGGLSPARLLDRYGDRLGVGVDLLTRNPAALVPVVGALVLLVVLLRPPPSVEVTFEDRSWRDALLTITLGAVVAYLANDSGASALGLGFGWALGGLLYVSLQTARGMMDRT